MPTPSSEIELGSHLPDFQMKAVDGRTYKLADFEDKKILVVGVTCNHCPYVKAYEDRINKLSHKFEGKPVQILCVNSNDDEAYPEDSFEAMQARAKEKAFHFLYLRDSDQSFARSIQAACTPEFYVYDSSRSLVYHGRLDDNQDESKVQKPYLEEVITALLHAKASPYRQTPALGCSIKWKV